MGEGNDVLDDLLQYLEAPAGDGSYDSSLDHDSDLDDFELDFDLRPGTHFIDEFLPKLPPVQHATMCTA